MYKENIIFILFLQFSIKKISFFKLGMNSCSSVSSLVVCCSEVWGSDIHSRKTLNAFIKIIEYKKTF